MEDIKTFSDYFELDKSQFELDFVDIPINHGDIPLFIDPYAISKRKDRWSNEAHNLIVDFFQEVINLIKDGESDQARYMLAGLREPNQTRMGLSKSTVPQGRGIGGEQSKDIYRALLDSSALKSGLISDLEECELLIEGIGPDKISDITTNIIRTKLIEYTQAQCDLWGIELLTVPSGPIWDYEDNSWSSTFVELPVCDGRSVLLVPKALARYALEFDHQEYYQHFVLNFLQNEHLNANSSLVRTLRDGTKRPPYKKTLKKLNPLSKSYLYEFSKENPEVLDQYRDSKPAVIKDLSVEELMKKAGLDGDYDGFTFTGLGEKLDEIQTGTSDADAYHTHILGVLTAIFYPSLMSPKKEFEIHEGRKRIDISFNNAATKGFFLQLPNNKSIPSALIFAECKNYSEDPTNPELDQLSGRFSTNRGKFGFLVCRNLQNKRLFIKRCKDTAQDGRGFIIVLDDDDIKYLLSLRQNNDQETITDYLNSRLAELL